VPGLPAGPRDLPVSDLSESVRTELRLRMHEIAKVRVRYGYRKIRVLLAREGWEVSRYLAYRLYREEGLGLRPRRSHRHRAAATTPGAVSFYGSEPV
jgi:hypothetical protein